MHILNASDHYQLYHNHFSFQLARCFILQVAQWKIVRCLFLNMSLVHFCSLLVILLCIRVRHQSLELRPISPCYLSVCSENFFTEVGIMSIIAYSPVYLQTGLSSLQSYSEGPCFQALMLHSLSPFSLSPTRYCSNCFLLHISVTGDL